MKINSTQYKVTCHLDNDTIVFIAESHHPILKYIKELDVMMRSELNLDESDRCGFSAKALKYKKNRVVKLKF